MVLAPDAPATSSPRPSPPAPVGKQLRAHLALDLSGGRGVDVALAVAAARVRGWDVQDDLRPTLDGAPLPAACAPVELVGPRGERTHVLRGVPDGRLVVEYAGRVRPAGGGAAVPDAGAAPAPVDPASPTAEAERLEALRPSRYCPSDELTAFAATHYGSLAERGAGELARAVRDDVATRLVYTAGASGPFDGAVQTLLRGAGVCRDFTHLVVALCRALELPARMAAVYAPGLQPMDFHAVAEVRVDGTWQVLDATGLAPRTGLVRIATGRDAADTAFCTTLGGRADLAEIAVTATTEGDLPGDAGGPVVLA